MEDSKYQFEYFLILYLAYCMVDKVANDPSCGLFAIFDGHGGR